MATIASEYSSIKRLATTFLCDIQSLSWWTKDFIGFLSRNFYLPDVSHVFVDILFYEIKFTMRGFASRDVAPRAITAIDLVVIALKED